MGKKLLLRRLLSQVVNDFLVGQVNGLPETFFCFLDVEFLDVFDAVETSGEDLSGGRLDVRAISVPLLVLANLHK